jgi:hypothetical protein
MIAIPNPIIRVESAVAANSGDAQTKEVMPLKIGLKIARYILCIFTCWTFSAAAQIEISVGQAVDKCWMALPAFEINALGAQSVGEFLEASSSWLAPIPTWMKDVSSSALLIEAKKCQKELETKPDESLQDWCKLTELQRRTLGLREVINSKLHTENGKAISVEAWLINGRPKPEQQMSVLAQLIKPEPKAINLHDEILTNGLDNTEFAKLQVDNSEVWRSWPSVQRSISSFKRDANVPITLRSAHWKAQLRRYHFDSGESIEMLSATTKRTSVKIDYERKEVMFGLMKIWRRLDASNKPSLIIGEDKNTLFSVTFDSESCDTQCVGEWQAKPIKLMGRIYLIGSSDGGTTSGFTWASLDGPVLKVFGGYGWGS